ncbi:MAG: tRNA-queuosine alpha-mannosyltransferase domain-containing protein [Opitutales bacterium]|jgi:glycosyltransferase involved in cell wall biosynthesis
MEKGDPMRISLLSPWYGGSHRRWADELKAVSRHRIDILSLEGCHWKWRLHGAAVTFAERIASGGQQYDLILADDMMDIAVFRGLLGQRGISTPVASYFHENQLGYPVSQRDTDIRENRDLHYGYINYTSALASERVFFNSAYHRNSFMEALRRLLSQFPDYTNVETIDAIAAKAEVLPLGMTLRELDQHRPERAGGSDRPLLLWNHRWEYDKRPDEFLRLLVALHEKGLVFNVALLGERGSGGQSGLDQVRRLLGSAIVQDGPVETFAEYARWLWKADILPVTAVQDFFGGSVVEAIYCGVHPVLPRRLAYPGHITDENAFYDGITGLAEKTADLITSGRWREPSGCRGEVARYDWGILGAIYDDAFARVVIR